MSSTVSAREWLAIFCGQRAVLLRREAYAVVWMRLAEFCRARAVAYAESARQAANLAEQAIREYARSAPLRNDALERALGGIRSVLDEREAEAERTA
jgi:hypothetical protein